MESIIHSEASSFQSKESADATAFFSALVRAETRLYNCLHDALRVNHGIAASQYGFLEYLRDHPRGRVADIARAFAIGIGAASKAVDRLERGGWIRRIPNPDDRRSSLLEVNDEGRALLAQAADTFNARLIEVLDEAGVISQVGDITEPLTRLHAFLEERNLGTPQG